MSGVLLFIKTNYVILSIDKGFCLNKHFNKFEFAEQSDLNPAIVQALSRTALHAFSRLSTTSLLYAD